MLLLTLAACGYDLVGRWEITALSIGQEVVEDAGFLDLVEQEADRGWQGQVYLVRYSYDSAARAFVPDPTPETRQASVDLTSLREGWSDTMGLDFPGVGGDLPAELLFVEHEPGSLLLEDADFAGGAGMTWRLVR